MTMGKRHITGALALLGWCVLVFWSCRFEAGFPMNYHWDEMSKSAQVKEGWRNLFHPLFILNTTEAWVDATSDKSVETYTAITQTGRALSALWVALAVWCVAILAWRQGGWVAAFMVAVLSGLSLAALEAGHVFKEHSALLLGIAVALLGMDAYAEKRNNRRALWMGLAVGFALATKYGAVVVLPFWVWMLLLRPDDGSNKTRNALLSVAGFVAAFVVVNFHPAWFSGGAHFGQAMQGEVSLLIHGHHGAGAAIPHRIFWERWKLAVPAVCFWTAMIAPWVVAALACRAKEGRAVSLARAGLLFAALANTVAISFVAKLSHEYLWPSLFFMSLPIGVLAGCAVRLAGESFGVKYIAPATVAVVAGFAVLLQGPLASWSALMKGFQMDARRDLVRYIEREVPPDALIAQDQFVGLYCEGDLFLIEVEKQVPNRVIGDYFLADMGTVAELKARGVRYVAINMEQGCHYLEMKLISPTSGEEFRRRQQFYQDLEREAELVWESKGGEPVQKRPWLRLYRMRE